MAGTITHQWNGTVLTITSDSGTSSCDLKGAKGDDGPRGAQGAPGSSVAEDSQKLGGVAAESYALKTDTIENANKLGNVAAAQYALKNGVPAHNLLDNSDFTNPVNQRGKTSWTNWNDYTVDRWIFRNNHVSEASVGVSGMSITTGSSEIYFEQPFDKSVIQRYIGKTLTLVFSTNEGLLIKKWTVVDGSYGRESIGNFQMTIGCLTNGWIDFVVPANKTINIYWAALYEGSYDASTLPAYVPKGYAAELAECQRYYYQSWNGSEFNKGYITREAISASSLALIEFPIEMRIVPTITFYTAANETGVVKEWTTNSSVSATQNYTSTKAFGVSGGGNFTIGKTYYFHYSASADL